MPGTLRTAAIVKQTLERLQRPSTAVVHSLDGSYAAIRIGQSPALVRNVRIEGDPDRLAPGQRVSIRWERQPGTFSDRPVITGEGGGQAAAVGGAAAVDNATLYYGPLGLAVKPFGIGLAHLSFAPALVGHVHADSFQAAGWQVTGDGVIYNQDTYIHPSGQITLGRAPNLVKLDSAHPTWRLWAGAEAPEEAPFRVDRQGNVWLESAYVLCDLASQDYLAGLRGWAVLQNGEAEFNNVRVRGALRSSVFEYSTLSAFAGTAGVYPSAGRLAAPLTTAGTPLSLTVEGPPFQAGDTVQVKDPRVGNAYVQVTGGGTLVGEGVYQYPAALAYGDEGVTFEAGVSVVSYGGPGAGFITLSADGQVGTGPNLSMATHSGQPWSPAPLLRIGRLDGYGSLAGYGWVVGDVNGQHAYYTPGSGLVVKGVVNATAGAFEGSVQIGENGALTAGNTRLSADGLFLDPQGEDPTARDGSIKFKDGGNPSPFGWISGLSDGMGKEITLYVSAAGALVDGKVQVQVAGPGITGTSQFHAGSGKRGLTVQGGLNVSTSTDNKDAGDGNIRYSGSLVAQRPSGASSGSIFVPLTTPLTHTSWDGNDSKAVGTYTISLEGWNTLLAEARAVLVLLSGQWAAAGSGSYAALRPRGGAVNYAIIRAEAANFASDVTAIIPTDATYRDIDVVVAGATMNNVVLRVLGYWV